MPRILQWETTDVDVLLEKFAALRSTGCILVVLIGDDALPKLLGDFWVEMEDTLLEIDMSVYKTSQKAVQSMLQGGVGDAMLKVAAQEIVMETA
ncbi:hypothetical protein AAVH_09933 [Aphelenchoides avenae]|nr:hypothetical protein AAVH_09933 [Aphelenchus avenae]